MRFVKMHGSGNDYVFVEQHWLPRRLDLARLAQAVSDRHFGVGSDGLVVLEASSCADAKMRIWNVDGSEAELCGNALLCTTKFLIERERVANDTARIETRAGAHRGRGHLEDGKVMEAEVSLPGPRLLSDGVFAHPFVTEVVGLAVPATALSLGNPHCVVFVDTLSRYPVEPVARALAGHPLFPDGANVEFVQPNADGTFAARIVERGSGETLACGSGACAVAVVSYLHGHGGAGTTIALRGGTVRVRWEGAPPVTNRTDFASSDAGTLWLRGPCTEVYEGRLTNVDSLLHRYEER
ncbi:MAG: diaminopimelate epimerase [Candidatus Schekmanbacteria bacterium]|nr:diaminopimelate epimerase [Candidatus Schekmanbacteria bacterium]